MSRPVRLLPAGPSPANGERGTGLVASIAAVAVFLAFLFFAVQLLFNLYATSVVTANSYDAARDVAAGGSTAAAERDLRSRMGRYSSRIDALDWSGSTADTVRLHITAHNPNLMFVGGGLLGFDTVDRTIVLRVERFRD